MECNQHNSITYLGSSVNDLFQPCTGDTALFPNNNLLASAQYLLDNGADNVNAKAGSKPIIIDNRSAQDYHLGHIPGAINTQWENFVLPTHWHRLV